ncbi:hypothetical protein HELRODRAFT_161228 [Helobdella robusta]|uniref:Pleiotrophin/Midkine N-terminal domain-containing protein n=1 Tax=Helobdella robusta TaxID=6412 RepID=T1ER85_HELRO|nr:hypothetical protein HELRODRAFT_161228 [Helobdella robusta]ESO02008.1 hypothetical protein HELRODRAFT_161228 [Helobdella robusta]
MNRNMTVLQKILCLILIVLAIVLTIEAKKDAKKNTKKEKECGEWMYEACQLTNKTASCGVGKQVAHRNGTCKKLTKEVSCKIKCPKPPSKKCKYGNAIISADSQCNPTTNTIPAVKNLLSGGPACQQSISINKKCKVAKAKDKSKKNKKVNKENVKKDAKESKAKVDKSIKRSKEDKSHDKKHSKANKKLEEKMKHQGGKKLVPMKIDIPNKSISSVQ